MLTRQILFRENAKKRLHIARRLIQAKFVSMAWKVPIPQERAQDRQSLDGLRALESGHAKLYWRSYFDSLGHQNQTRRSKNPISSALDAVSKFVSGIFLRWTVYHHLSPYHGFMHVPTDYPALIYDLMEPYRGYIEREVFDVIKATKLHKKDDQNYTGNAINAVEEFLDLKVYTPTTRQIVTFHELFHGVILALLAYMRGDAQRFIVPMPGVPTGGRPVKPGYKLYGRSAGPTDFWDRAREASYAQKPRAQRDFLRLN